MAKISNSEITQKAIKDLRLDVAREKMPTETSDKIVLTYPLNSKICDIVERGTSSSSGSTTIYTTPSNKDFFLTNIFITVQEDATSDNLSTFADVTINGASKRILDLRKITTTACTRELALNFNFPVKIDRGTNITMGNSFTVGNAVKTCGIVGYTQEK